MQRQLTIKIVTIVVLGLLLLIPTSMVQYKVYERQGYLEEAKAAVARSWTGAQQLMTPVLVIPYRLHPLPKSGNAHQNEPSVYIKRKALLPTKVHTEIDVANKRLFKGIYEVPVYNSDIKLNGLFSAEKVRQQIAAIKELPRFDSLGTPYLSLHVSDMRGIDQAPSLLVNTQPVTLEPGSQLRGLAAGLHATLAELPESHDDLNFSLQLSLRGMGSLCLVLLADEASASMRSDWPHPEFTGASLPLEREISATGFTARWSSTRYSSNGATLLAHCLGRGQCDALLAASSGVNFIEPVDIYLQSERSLKYAMLFIGLSFITFFIFEHLKHVRIHPIQYAFVGLAIAVFYLLLISLAEHVAFYWAYSLSVFCCLALILFYVRYMLKSVISALLFSLMLLTLYGLLYVIVQAEDFALLMGALLVFGVLAVLMTVSRNIDWYRLSEAEEGNKVADHSH